jgi:hypothetical protein
MDELQMLRAVLTEPDPSSDVVDRSHHRLQNTMRNPVRRRRAPWAAAVLGLTAAAATAAVMIASTVAAPRATPEAAIPSGRQILLAAAATAESKPATSGTYWHVHTVLASFDGKIRLTSGSWTRRDGLSWTSSEPGKISKLSKPDPIQLSGTDLGIDQIQRLPTDPDRLLETLREHKLPGQPPLADPITMSTNLLSELPAPPKVRAAAFRALASLPHIKNLGKTNTGAYALELDMEGTGTRMIVDPTTTTTTAEHFTSLSGARQLTGSRTSTGEWTNQLPPYELIPLSQQKHPGFECHDEGNTLVCTKVG